MSETIINDIFNPDVPFHIKCIALFHFQYQNNKIYKAFVDALRINIGDIQTIEQIPFLPISCFKTHQIITATNELPATLFISSGTTATLHAHHYIKDVSIYQKSILQGFKSVFGDPANYCFLALLPSYLEKGNASLVYMVNYLMQQSNHPNNGFYLDDFDALQQQLLICNTNNRPTMLFGVTYALLDFVEQYDLELNNIILIETGGMKGRKKEITADEVTAMLTKTFNPKNMYREYGMTELLSQAYARIDENYTTPYWMKAFIRDVNDPLTITTSGKGVLNIIDLANIYSCSFIATDDLITLLPDGSFSVEGRLDQSDQRGCSLLYV